MMQDIISHLQDSNLGSEKSVLDLHLEVLLGFLSFLLTDIHQGLG